MKKNVFFMALLLFAVTSFGQSTTPTFSRDHYLRKIKIQKTIAWILLGTGTGIATYGLLNINNYSDNEWGFNATGALIAIGGAVVGVTSIPFFTSAARNKRKAAALSFGAKRNLLLQQNSFACKIQPAVTLKIGL